MATNKNHPGEVSIDIDGTTYTMALTLDAMCALEEMFSAPEKVVRFNEIADAADAGSIRHVRAMIWAMLQYHHPTIKLEDVSELVQKAGGFAKFGEKFKALTKPSRATKSSQ